MNYEFITCAKLLLITCFLISFDKTVLSWSFEFKPLSRPKMKALFFNTEYAKLELTRKFGFIQPNYHL